MWAGLSRSLAVKGKTETVAARKDDSRDLGGSRLQAERSQKCRGKPLEEAGAEGGTMLPLELRQWGLNGPVRTPNLQALDSLCFPGSGRPALAQDREL